MELNQILLLIGAFEGLLFILVILFWVLTNRKTAVLKKFLQSAEGRDLVGYLQQLAERLDSLEKQVNELKEKQIKQQITLTRCLQNKAVVRFNAFEDTGSDLSFAVALLDERGDGVVLSSLYGRQDCRTYAKPLKNGQSRYPLTDEEKEAIALALSPRKSE
ncbi:MAG: DUF4446 family protein [Bacillota bacterium]